MTEISKPLNVGCRQSGVVFSGRYTYYGSEAAEGKLQSLTNIYVAGRDNLSQAMHCPGAIGNPFVHMRFGQCQLELKTIDRAADELMRAYMGAGPDIFKDEDPSYLASPPT